MRKRKSRKTILLAIVGVIILALALLYLLGKKSVHTELVIEASPEEIWAVLMDEEGYKDWNPALIPIDGEIAVGNTVRYKMVEPDGDSSTISAKVVKVVENQLLNQRGGIPGILTFNHRYVLDEVSGGTNVTIHEDYAGIGVPFWNPGWVESAYASINEALSNRVNQLRKNELSPREQRKQ